MRRIIHISVILTIVVGGLSGCLKKKKKSEADIPAPQTLNTNEAESQLALESQPASNSLSIPDPLVGLPVLGTWRPIKQEGAPLPCPGTTRTFWTGTNLLVFGHLKIDGSSSKCLPAVHVWEPMTDTWRALPEIERLPQAPDVSLDTVEVFLAGNQLYVVSPKTGGPSGVLDLPSNTWKQVPPSVTALIWPDHQSELQEDSKSKDFAFSRSLDSTATLRPRNYISTPQALTVWVDHGFKSVEWATGTSKDLPAVGWENGSAPSGSTEKTLIGAQDSPLLAAIASTVESDASKTPRINFAVSLNPAVGAPWQTLPSPSIVDAQGKPKCTEIVPSLTTALDLKLVMIGMDSSQDELKSTRTCFITIDPQNGAITQASHLLLSQIAGRKDGSYEYLDQGIQTQVRAGRRIVFRLKRDGGVVSINDDASQGFVFQGYDERFLILDPLTGGLSLTPPLNGSGVMDKIYLVGTERGLIVWGGHRPKADGTDSSANEGSLLEWPI